MAQVRILVVEDEKVVAQDIRRTLESYGYAVPGIASSGEEALRMTEDLGPDLVLMDIVLQGEMDGVSAAEMIRDRLHVPVIYLTAYADDSTILRASQTEPFGYILKPFDDRELRIAVEMALYKHQAQIRIQESEERYRRLMESAPDSILVTDAQTGLITDCNREAENLLGLPTEQVIGRHHLRLYPAQEEPRYQDLFREAVDRGKVVVPDAVICCADNRKVSVDICLSAYQAGGRTLVMGIFRDVTERKKIMEKLQQQERLAAVGQLAAGIAHDFNNILQSVMMSAELVLRQPSFPQHLARRLENILLQGERGAMLIRQILDFSRRSITSRQPLSLGPFVKDVLKVLRRTIPENIAIIPEMEPGDFIISADATQVQQVITNMMLNARDAMPGGGDLRLGLSFAESVPGMPSAEGDEPRPRWIRLTIADTGVGIPQEFRSHIFEPFFTTKEAYLGSGLGLSQVYGIIQQHGGHITFTSEVGQGTTFHLFWPALPVPGDGGLGAIEAGAVPQGRGETILLVEDDPSTLETTKDALESLGYRVLMASNGHEAQELYRQRGREIALVLADVVMPRMGGMDLCRHLKEMDDRVKVILMSGYPLTDRGKDPASGSISGWINKPVSIHHLAQMISHVLGAN